MAEEFSMSMENLNNAMLGNLLITFKNGYSVSIAVGCSKVKGLHRGGGRNCSPVRYDESETIYGKETRVVTRNIEVCVFPPNSDIPVGGWKSVKGDVSLNQLVDILVKVRNMEPVKEDE